MPHEVLEMGPQGGGKGRKVLEGAVTKPGGGDPTAGLLRVGEDRDAFL